jgi:5-(carboxyamino)imidazole ribonucleotide synthase
MYKIGILGGGQLGRMLLQSAANYPVESFVMENDTECPAAHLCHHFIKGDIRNYNDVYNFGKGLDAITIEIESVNEDALQQLEDEGVKVYPRPSALRIIKNKILQKEYYKKIGAATADFKVTSNKEELLSGIHLLPAVHKLATGGYDGRGVQVILSDDDVDKGFDHAAVLERMVDIDKEISVIVAVGSNGETVLYPPVDMVFDSQLNLLDYQISPADLDPSTLNTINELATKVVKGFNSAGLFAVEMFIEKNGDVLVNETAPRVHNSGHHSIEANYSSQFDMLWRIMLNYPLGNTSHILPAAIVNVLGADGYSGKVYYEGLEEVLRMQNVFVHLYGKKETRPGRKMGHITILGSNRDELIQSAHTIKNTLRVISR